MTARRDDAGALRARAGNLTQRDLLRFASARGWRESTGGGKDSHRKVTKSGRRPVTIPQKVGRILALAIIDQLEADDV